jgi:Ca2+-binding RTX toxin-like protein
MVFHNYKFIPSDLTKIATATWSLSRTRLQYLLGFGTAHTVGGIILNGGSDSHVYNVSQKQKSQVRINDTGTTGVDTLVFTPDTSGLSASTRLKTRFSLVMAADDIGLEEITLTSGSYAGIDCNAAALKNGIKINGSAQSDIIIGSAFADTLIGGAGVDRLTGGAGIDRLTGGAGADVFTFAAGDALIAPGGFDTITDFQAGVDLIDAPGDGLRTISVAWSQRKALPGDWSATHFADQFYRSEGLVPGGACAVVISGRTLLVVDCNNNGFDQLDTVVEITGYSGSLSSITVI